MLYHFLSSCVCIEGFSLPDIGELPDVHHSECLNEEYSLLDETVSVYYDISNSFVITIIVGDFIEQ